jgi:AcrR family transcriptional regulator
VAAPARTYAGRSGEDRRRERREKLIAAGIELMGTSGSAGLSVRAVLRESGVGERYFYESFANLSAFRVAVYDEVLGDVMTATMAAVEDAGPDLRRQAEAGLRTFAQAATADPRRTRIHLFERYGGDEALFEHTRQVFNAFAAVIAQRIPEEVAATPIARRVTAVELTGAIHMSLMEWVQGGLDVTLSELVDHWVLLMQRAGLNSD